MTVKEKLYKSIIKRELIEKYEEDRYGIRCISCGKYNPAGKQVSHYRRCPTGQIERIILL